MTAPVPPTSCPQCHRRDARVVLTRPTRDYLHILRRRHCPGCDYRWYTLQGAERRIQGCDFRWTGAYKRELGLADFELMPTALPTEPA